MSFYINFRLIFKTAKNIMMNMFSMNLKNVCFLQWRETISEK